MVLEEGAAGVVGKIKGGMGATENSPFVEQDERADGTTTFGDEFEFVPESVAGDGGEPACAVLD